MKKTLFILFTVGLIAVNAIGQSVQEGINHLYADRFKSAENTFQRMLSVNPNVIDAIYWLGQTYLDDDKNSLAKQLYEKALQSNGNAPLLLVGMGHVELLENNTTGARQRFETALTLSRTKKGDDPAVLNAIGRANVDAKTGDLKYAIEKLELAAQRDPKNPDIYVNLGNAYRKANPGQGGGQAYQSYQKALEVNPNFPYAYIRIAKLFETQRNWELVLQNLNNSVAKDPNFSLGYYELFYYYFYRAEFPQAENFFQKYLASRRGEDQIEHDYLQSQFCCAITKAKAVETAMGNRVKPKVLKQLAYSYTGKGDFANAKRYVDDYFAKEKEGYVPADYVLKADVYSGVGVPCEELYGVFMEGANADTVLQSKLEYLNNAADYFKSKSCKKQEADMRMVWYNARPTPNPAYFVNYGILYLQANELQKADSLFTAYTKAFPDSIYGYDWQGRVSSMLDTTMSVEPHVSNLVKNYIKTLEIAETDRNRFKSQGVRASLILAGYYNNTKKDKDQAIAVAQRGLAFDTSNAQLKSIIEILTKPAGKPKTPAKTGTNKPTSKAIKQKKSAVAIKP